MADASNGCLRQLVRDIQNVNVVVTDEPERLRFDGREWPEFLSVPVWSLSSLLRNANRDDGWVFKAARDGDTEGPLLTFDWVPVWTAQEVRGESWLLAVHPRFAKYSEKIGLELGVKGTRVERTRARKGFQRYSYNRETYGGHVAKVVRAGMAVESRYSVATSRLATAYGVGPETITDWLRWIWTLHDVGKLSVDWQEAIWSWQNIKTPTDRMERESLAHSDYDPVRDFEASKASPRRPPHAAEGAFAASNSMIELICEGDDRFVDVAWAALTSIVTHHGPRTTPQRVFRLIPEASEVVRNSFVDGSRNLELNEPKGPSDIDDFKENLFAPADLTSWRHLPIYLYFCRRLRLADQGSFEETR
jgi:CRISPR-associated endonuclease/helicase Cas3